MSSPIRAPKQKIQSFAYQEEPNEDDDYFEAPRHPIRQQPIRNFETDGFVIKDDDFENDFAPVRIAKPSKNRPPQRLGTPITSDQRLAELSDNQQCALIDFMGSARRQRQRIMADKGHREPIFSDVILREMGLELPRNLNEMRLIPNIRPEMVDLYGKKFLPLVEKTRRMFMNDVPVRKHLPLDQHFIENTAIDDDEDDDEVLDPNHQNIIDLCSDTEVMPIALDDDTDYSYDDDEEDDMDGEVHTSHHFTQHVDPEVEAFNNRMSQLGPAIPKSATTQRASNARGGAKAAGGRKGKPFRRSGSGNVASKSFGGVRKRAAKGSGGRVSGGAAKKPAGGSRNGGASGGWGSIMAMPT